MDKRCDGRIANEMRAVSISAGCNPYAEGSAKVCFGTTVVLCTASVSSDIPKWMEPGSGGWITAEYGMLPRATHTRSKREASAGKQGGRTVEIQRLIGRSLRRAVDLGAIEGISITIDCDVLSADGGTRTAAISGGWVALVQALSWCVASGRLSEMPAVRRIAAVSAGVVAGTPLLDLCYEEDSIADFDLNAVFADGKSLVEVQGSAEKGDISETMLTKLLGLARQGVEVIGSLQAQALVSAEQRDRDAR